MAIRLEIPIIPEHEISALAERFLREHGVWSQIPVPIEHIIDVGLRINIIPVRGLRDVHGIDAFISGDSSEICVDGLVYQASEHKYRFSLAHEMAHYLLHRHLLAAYPIHNIADYAAFRAQISPESYDLLEKQADSMAGFILVPRPYLLQKYRQAKRRATEMDYALHRGTSLGVTEWLSRQFQVPPAVIAKRVESDHLDLCPD